MAAVADRVYYIDVYPPMKAGGFTVSLAAKVAQGVLTTAAAAATIVSAVFFFQKAIPIVMVAMIASSVALTLLLLTTVYPFVEKYMPAPIQSIVNGTSSILKETLFVPLVLLLMAGQALFGKREESTVENGDEIVLMVHGYVGTSAHFLYLRYRLEQEKVGSVYTMDLGNPLLSIDDYAQKVREKVSDLLRNHPNKRVTLVGHSMGGVVVSKYLSSCTGQGHIKKVITLGSPLQGTYLSNIGIGKCAKEMKVESKYLEDLETQLKNYTVPFVTVGSTTDLIIVPNSAAFFKEKSAKKVIAPGMGHATYLFSDAVANCLAEEIRG